MTGMTDEELYALIRQDDESLEWARAVRKVEEHLELSGFLARKRAKRDEQLRVDQAIRTARAERALQILKHPTLTVEEKNTALKMEDLSGA